MMSHLAGPIFLAVTAGIYNAIAFKFNKPTISMGVRWIAKRNIGSEIAGAVLGGLLAHWLLNDGKAEQ